MIELFTFANSAFFVVAMNGLFTFCLSPIPPRTSLGYSTLLLLFSSFVFHTFPRDQLLISFFLSHVIMQMQRKANGKRRITMWGMNESRISFLLHNKKNSKSSVSCTMCQIIFVLFTGIENVNERTIHCHSRVGTPA